MDIITWLADVSYRKLDIDEVIELFGEKHYQIAEKIILKFRKKKVKVNDEVAKQLARNGIINFWSEIIKYVIVLLIALKLNIFLSAFLVMNVFSIFRWNAGGVHMSTFNKCFVIMIIFFISLGYLISHIHTDLLICFIYLSLGTIWSYIMAYKHAPQERLDKTDKDCDNGHKIKYRIMKYILITYIVCLIFIQHKLIILSIFSGMLLEIFTITQIGTKIFQWIDKKKVVL